MAEEITIDGKEVVLSEDRAVWAGKHDGSWYIRFTNKGVEHKLRLSFEAADALVTLLGFPSAGTEKIMKFMFQLKGDETPTMRWQQVIDTVIAPDSPPAQT